MFQSTLTHMKIRRILRPPKYKTIQTNTYKEDIK